MGNCTYFVLRSEWDKRTTPAPVLVKGIATVPDPSRVEGFDWGLIRRALGIDTYTNIHL